VRAVFFHGGRINNQIVNEIEDETSFQVGEQLIYNPAQSLTSHTNAHGEFIELNPNGVQKAVIRRLFSDRGIW